MPRGRWQIEKQTELCHLSLSKFKLQLFTRAHSSDKINNRIIIMDSYH